MSCAGLFVRSSFRVHVCNSLAFPPLARGCLFRSLQCRGIAAKMRSNREAAAVFCDPFPLVLSC